MNILFPLGAFFPSQIGGPCNTLYWHTSTLTQYDIGVVIVSTTVGINSGTVEVDKFIPLESSRTYYGQGGIFRFKTINTALQEIKNTDIIHLNSLFSPMSWIVFFYRSIFFRQKNVVWSVRGELNINALKYSYWKKKPFLWLFKRLNKGVLYHSTSAEETKDIKQMFPNAAVVQIPNLILPSKRIEKNVANYLLFVGRIHPIKGIHKLIKAVKLSKYFKEKNFELHIVGKHEDRHVRYRDELTTLINSLGLETTVLFKGHLEGMEKEKAYANAYALILPSETENFGNVIVEALNQGTPVITSFGTPWEILETSKAGFYCSNSPDSLSEKIDQLLMTDKKTYKQMINNSYNLVDQNYNVNTRIHKWIEVYKNLHHENTK